MPLIDTGIESLPLLPENYSRYWDWSKGNVDATAEETVAAYNALVNGGLTEEFKVDVWNDIVTVLCEVLEDAELPFDTSYGLREDVGMTYSDDLSSYRFNGVCINIDNFLPSAWSWWYNSDRKGYIGRKRVIGASQIELFTDADVVYGHYILEITEKLNKLIDLLKNKIDFSEFSFLEISNTSFSAAMGRIKLAEMLIEELSKTFINANLINAKGSPLIWRNPVFSLQSSRVRLARARDMIWRNPVFSSNSANLIKKHTVAMWLSYTLESLHSARIKRCLVAPVSFSELLKSRQQKELRKAKSAPFDFSWIAKTLYNHDFAAFHSAIVSNQSMSFTEKIVPLEAMRAAWILAENISNSKNEAVLLSGKSVEAESLSLSNTLNLADFAKKRTSPIALSEDVTTQTVAEISEKKSASLECREKSQTLIVAVLAFKDKETGWLDPVRTGSDLYIRQVWSSAYIDGSLHIDRYVWYNPIQEGDDLYVRQAWSAWRQGEELNIDTVEFYRPEQRDDDLYIRSATTINTDGTNAEIDMDYYLPPIQEGSNLYIRQDFIGGN